MMFSWLASQATGQTERFGGPRSWALVLGVLMFATGIFLLFSHKRFLNNFLDNSHNERERRFELRKFRRRSLVGSMIASVGCMIAALYWVTDPRIFSIFILLILGLLLAILVVACFDLFSVSLQAATRTEATQSRKMVEAFLEERKNRHRDGSASIEQCAGEPKHDQTDGSASTPEIDSRE